MIRSIELRNWKTHKETRLEFAKGTNILIGQMGAGKSSVMDAIAFALFGMFPAIQHRRVSNSKLIRNKPDQQNTASVSLVFDLDGNEYTVRRELTLSGKHSATIEKNGEYLQSQPERVSEEVERILKVDYDLFSKAVYSEQNKLDYFLDIRPADRKKQIDGLLGLDKFAVAQENTTSLISRIRDMVEEGERITKEFDAAKANAELEELREQLGRLQKEKQEAEEGIKAHGTEKSKIEKELTELKDRNSRKIALAKDIEGLRSRVKTLDVEIEKLQAKDLPKKSEIKAQIDAFKTQLEKLKANEREKLDEEKKHNSLMARLDVQITTARKDAQDSEKIAKELEKNKKSDIEKEIAETSAAIDKLSTDVAHSRSAILDAESQTKELSKHLSKCPVCERALDKETVDKILAGKRSAIEEHRKKAKEADEQLLSKKIMLKDLNIKLSSINMMEERLKEHTGISGKLKALESEMAKARSDYETSKKGREEISKEVMKASEKLQSTSQVMESVERMERYTADKDKTSTEISAKTKEHDSIKVDQKLLDEMQQKLVHANSEISKHTANLASATKYLKDKQAQISEKEADIERIKRMFDDVTRKRALTDNLAKFKISLAETQSVMRSQLTTKINDIMDEVWKDLYPYGDYQGIMLDVSEDDYNLKVNTIVNNEHVWEDVEAIASGGERSTACLAMRIAFSLVLVPNLKWLILDEPTHNIDQEGIAKFVKMFNDTLPGIIDQVFVITHDEALKQVNSGRVYTFNRNKNENRETEIAV